jgi:Tfp pilus assembly PilM family ATPase
MLRIMFFGEAEQFIPFGVDESEMDYHIIGEMTDEEDILDVLVVAAKIPVIEDFQNILKVAGFENPCGGYESAFTNKRF